MKRLIDEDCEPGSPESLLADLVRATPPFEPAPFEQRRVFARVTQAARHPRALAFRVGATVALLSGAGLAAAGIEHSIVGMRAHAALVSPVTESPPPVAPLPAPIVLPISDISAPAATMTVPKVTDPLGARLKAAAHRFKDGEDPAPVLEAIRALRNDGDAARAGTLLAEYLRKHPRSVLSEDALALSIESALARHDSRQAAEFGRRYLSEFSNGRYRAFALRAVAP